ncbi:MAG: hypothetical protein ACI33L_07120 [Limosilactobacillus sp.]|uniref:hypothetical protein n=1 Tax=Limosilactobacillus sp. TaxID=2773925 RepID=UPI002A749327|nr:hypothetical protein [Limosilactobacillus sp.]MDD7693522.1 hypothetical protein [Lactobacillaceae bacterium]MDY2803686.1 hypothetical protein [Limosilactobacillus sp.]
MKRLLLLCLVIIGLVAAERSVQAATSELTASPLTTIAVPITSGEQREPRQRKLQFRARLLKHWWQPRTGAVISRRPIITKII